MMSRYILCEDVGYNIHTSVRHKIVQKVDSQKGENTG